MAQLDYQDTIQTTLRTCKCSRCENEVINPPKSKRAETILCANCAHFQKYGESIFATNQRKLREKQLQYREKKKETPVTPKKRIVQVSEKQKEINEQLKKVKDKITEHAFNTNSHYCVGCGVTSITLDRSHILSVKHRSDLQMDKNNIQLLCRSCHNVWEHGKIDAQINLNCFLESVEYIYKNDSERFQKLFHKLLDYYEKVKYTSVLKLIRKIENFEEIEV